MNCRHAFGGYRSGSARTSGDDDIWYKHAEGCRPNVHGYIQRDAHNAANIRHIDSANIRPGKAKVTHRILVGQSRLAIDARGGKVDVNVTSRKTEGIRLLTGKWRSPSFRHG